MPMSETRTERQCRRQILMYGIGTMFQPVPASRETQVVRRQMIRTAEFHLKTAMMACPNKTGGRGIDELKTLSVPLFFVLQGKKKG